MTNPPMWWLLTRATGIVAWGLLTLTTVWGLLPRTRLVPGVRPRTLRDLHRFLAGLAVVFTGLHLAGLVLDDYVRFDAVDLLVPFASKWRPLPVALGVVALYLLAALIVTSLLMNHLPRRWWHRVHLSAYLLFWIATMHAVTAGTDTHNQAMLTALNTAIIAVLLLTLVRVLAPGAQRIARARFHPLTVAEVRRETPDAVSVAFTIPAKVATVFRFRPGQHITLRTTLDGVEVRRPYSICSDVNDPMLRIAVKHEPNGRMSTWVNTRLRAGDVVDVMAPAGQFATDLNPRRTRRILAVAAGCGITPVLSIISSVLTHEPHSRCVLLYGNRTAREALFLNHLTALAQRYPTRLRVLHLRSREPATHPDLSGRINANIIRRMAGPLALPGVDDAFLCGPTDMTTQIRQELLHLGLSPERVHIERFTSPTAAPSVPGEHRDMTVIHDGTVTTVHVGPEETILDSGLRAGLDLPYSCRSGTCGTCEATTVAGEVTDTANTVVANGTVLTCTTRPLSNTVVVDFDTV